MVYSTSLCDSGTIFPADVSGKYFLNALARFITNHYKENIKQAVMGQHSTPELILCICNKAVIQ